MNIDDFWTCYRVLPNGCWEWAGGLGGMGYGMLRLDGANYTAHRIAWSLAMGCAIPAGMEVCHSCDYRPCVNPSHLFLGTHAENMRDAARKGRSAAAQRSRKDAKLTPQDVVAIRVAEGKQWDIARRFGVTQSTVSRIKLQRRWSDMAS